MRVFSSWHALCVLGFAVACLCMNGIQYEDYPYNYDNEISEDQQEGDPASTPCPAVDFSRWDKLFIALEDSHMRQNMLLESLEQCRGGMVSVKSQVERLARGTCQQCLPGIEAACKAKAEQASLKLQRGLVELAQGEVERERRLNATLHMLLHSSHEENSRLKRLEKGLSHRVPVSSGPADGRTRYQPTARPAGLSPPFGLGTRPPSSSGPKEPEVTSPMDMATMEKALVAIATELQRVHLQLSRVIEQAGTSRKDSGD
ncbi:pentraxin-related protein PTX3-like [Solea solea]|uniref:pentraxin-related protein PTX3-like n=1 Tax=Solea solea TaxID=90069 RepID=UPI00272C4DCE|nr:pentraxin-related protein PTX3-like [Solea solea]